MASGFRQTNGRVIAGEGDPADGDALCTNLALFPENTLYVNNNTGALFVRGAETGFAVDWITLSSPGGSSLFPTTGTGTATGNVIGDLDGSSLTISEGGNSFLFLDPTAGAEQAIFRAYNITGGDNQGGIAVAISNDQADTSVSATFDGGTKQANIGVSAAAGGCSISHTADVHTFNIASQFSVTDGLNDFIGTNKLLTYIISSDETANGVIKTKSELGDNDVNFTISSFDGTGNPVTILGDGIAKSITYTADTHNINGAIVTDSNPTFNGTLADAITGGKSIVNGLIID